MPTQNNERVFLFDDAFRKFGHLGSGMKDVLGGKGAGLAEMTQSKVSVPPGMTIITSVCRAYYDEGNRVPSGLFNEVRAKLSSIESQVGRKLGDEKNPLLLSVRSGAKFSMPGMMDTILNLGLNDKTVAGMASLTSNERFSWDSYRRFIQMYSNVVLGISKDDFEDILHHRKKKSGASSDNELSISDLKSLVSEYKDLVSSRVKEGFPTDVYIQLEGAIEAVFRSWNNPRAVYYRNLHKIDHTLGTGVTVQSMVFGNFDESSGTGVCFTRNPSTGERVLYGEFLVNAQGEDVVAGIRTPRKIAELKTEMPAIYKELDETTKRLEAHFKDMQDIEFTIEQGKLYLLQTRTGKRTAHAAVKIAVDLVSEGVLSTEDALLRVEPTSLNQLLLPSFDPEAKDKARKDERLLATGLNASPGAAIGEIVFDPDESERLAATGRKLILVRVETCPDDIHGIVPAQGIVTSRGGMTSHAAVVARGMGKPCVAGCESFRVNLEREEVEVRGEVLRKGDIISIDGASGEIFKGEIPTKKAELSKEFYELLSFADGVKKLGVRTNADTPEDALKGRELGAKGIGLCRTEHMFMNKERLPWVQAMILASSLDERKKALEKLLPMQRKDFEGIFTAMEGLPVTIRLLDPPLHEFLPSHDELVEEVANHRARGERCEEKEALLKKVRDLKESNPMMGLRGCRLGLLYPEISRMQVRAIFEAAIEVKKAGKEVFPEIMIPLIGIAAELEIARAELEAVAKDVMTETGVRIPYQFGTMIEIPRACVTADEIAHHAEFFSFGTNDLTQMTFGYSRDDAEGKFLQKYLDGVECIGERRKILTQNPFEVLDRQGVGKLMDTAVRLGREVKPSLKLGICGEHGGEPNSIAFAHSLGLTYVSCSPYRVPLARLAAAQAVIRETRHTV